MTSKEAILGSLVTEEIKSISERLDFWEKSIDIPRENSWQSPNHLTLGQFLEKHPTTSDKSEVPLYGIAWEFIWGENPPPEITQARENLLLRAKLGLEINDTEEMWLKLISIDTELF